MNLRLDLAYDGAPFRGYARQPDVPTVQGELEAALERVVGAAVETHVAGRTDAGVHALGQVVSVHGLPDDADPQQLQRALNRICAPTIAVRSCRKVADDFHARHSARSRLYVYALLVSDVHDPFLAPTTLHHPARLDVDAMNEAAGHLLGSHDFSSFGRRFDKDATPERTLFELRCVQHGPLLRVRARANAFIQQMVRSLVGTLVEVGEGRRSPDEMPGVVAARDRAAAGAVAPPHALCLVAVEYDGGWSHPAV